MGKKKQYKEALRVANEHIRELIKLIPAAIPERERYAPVEVAPVVEINPAPGVGKQHVVRRPRGRQGGNMSLEKAREIRRLKAEGNMTSKEIAAHMGVHRTTVDACVRGASWPEE